MATRKADRQTFFIVFGGEEFSPLAATRRIHIIKIVEKCLMRRHIDLPV